LSYLDSLPTDTIIKDTLFQIESRLGIDNVGQQGC